MKKILLSITLTTILAAGCSSTQQAQNQPTTTGVQSNAVQAPKGKTPDSKPVTENLNPYAKCGIADADLDEKVLTSLQGPEQKLSDFLTAQRVVCSYNSTQDMGSLENDQNKKFELFTQSCGGAAIATPGSDNNPIAKDTIVIFMPSHCQESDKIIP